MIPKKIRPTELREKVYNEVRVAVPDLFRDLRGAEADVVAGRTHTPAEARGFVARRATNKRGKRRRG
jgi:hypothetical protein